MSLTVEAWIVYAIITAFIIIAGILIGLQLDKTIYLVACIAISILLSGAILAGINWYFTNTASGARAIKTQESNFNQGVNK